MGKLDGKVSLITGAGSGTGRAAARLFAGEGSRVMVAKTGIIRLTRTIALDYAGKSIRATCICPGIRAFAGPNSGEP